jgi:hypothetical protein
MPPETNDADVLGYRFEGYLLLPRRIPLRGAQQVKLQPRWTGWSSRRQNKSPIAGPARRRSL